MPGHNLSELCPLLMNLDLKTFQLIKSHSSLEASDSGILGIRCHLVMKAGGSSSWWIFSRYLQIFGYRPPEYRPKLNQTRGKWDQGKELWIAYGAHSDQT